MAFGKTGHVNVNPTRWVGVDRQADAKGARLQVICFSVKQSSALPQLINQPEVYPSVALFRPHLYSQWQMMKMP